MKCGFSKKIITPPLGTALVGYYRERLAKGVIDDLYVKAVAFDDGEGKAVVIEADLCYLTKESCDQYRKDIAEACQVAEDAVFISCNHTHTGPLISKDFASDKEADPGYMAFLRSAVRDVAIYAMEDLKPARFFVANTEAKGISFVRRYRMKDGTSKTNPQPLDPNIDHAWGEPNETLKLLKIVREDADDIFVFNFGTHSDTINSEYISADFSAYACAAIEGAIPGTQSVFLLAPQGDVNHHDPSRPKRGHVISERVEEDPKEKIAHARYMGRVIAGNILAVCDRATEIPADGIRFGSVEVEVPSHQENEKLAHAIEINDLYEKYGREELARIRPGESIAEARRVIRLQNGPESFRFSVFAIRLGEFVLAGLPGEPFTAIRNAVDAGTPFENTMVCALVNDSGGYFPSTAAYSQGGYEAQTSSFGPGTEEIIVDGMIRLLKSLK